MQKKTTVEQLLRELSTISETFGMALAPYDVDRFLSLGSYHFYDPTLDAAPTVESVETLVKLGVPRWFLTNKGTVSEVFAILDARRSRGLASVPQARLLRDRGHPRPWAVLFSEVGSELVRLRREKEELDKKCASAGTNQPRHSKKHQFYDQFYYQFRAWGSLFY